MSSGSIVLFNASKGYGFIRPDTGDADVFVHISDAQEGGIEALVVGDRLEFVIEADARSGKPRAADIRRAGH